MRGRSLLVAVLLPLLSVLLPAHAEDKVFEIPTRSGITQRFLLIPAADAKAAVILFPGGHGGLQFSESGSPGWGRNNFLVRSAHLFAAQGLTVAVIDAPSDRFT